MGCDNASRCETAATSCAAFCSSISQSSVSPSRYSPRYISSSRMDRRAPLATITSRSRSMPAGLLLSGRHRSVRSAASDCPSAGSALSTLAAPSGCEIASRSSTSTMAPQSASHALPPCTSDAAPKRPRVTSVLMAGVRHWRPTRAAMHSPGMLSTVVSAGRWMRPSGAGGRSDEGGGRGMSMLAPSSTASNDSTSSVPSSAD
mmetsp:Transcript_43608/g.123560  ORF Transcript_43608/g.123560 Transcript_43608/m.123560 type:complete len:203 (-) Transcript_43608:93-701(-)